MINREGDKIENLNKRNDTYRETTIDIKFGLQENPGKIRSIGVELKDIICHS